MNVSGQKGHREVTQAGVHASGGPGGANNTQETVGMDGHIFFGQWLLIDDQVNVRSHLQQRGTLEGFAALATRVWLLPRVRPERESYPLKRTAGGCIQVNITVHVHITN